MATGSLNVTDNAYSSSLTGAVVYVGYITAVDNPYTSGNVRSYLAPTRFRQEDILGSGDLTLEVWEGRFDSSSYAEYQYNPIWTTYGIFGFDSSNDHSGHPVGYEARTPVNPNVGDFYASMVAPDRVGRYQIRWMYQKDLRSYVTEIIQDFEVDSLGVDSTHIY